MGAIAACTLACAAAIFAGSQAVASAGSAPSQSSFESLIQSDLAYAGQRLGATLAAIPPGQYPAYTAANGSWVTTDASQWTSGFLPGELWLMYQATGNAGWRTAAEHRQQAIFAQQNNTDQLNLGFMLFDSVGNGYRLTGNPNYRQVLLNAARSLVS